MQRLNVLEKGMKVGLTAPAGPVSRESVKEAAAKLEELGYETAVGGTCFMNERTYLAGPAETRAAELNRLFADDEIKGIICLRGGYGTLQLLPLLDYSLIGRNPKPFVGYSDITALHIAFQQKSGLRTIHGPMAASDLVKGDAFTVRSLQALLSSAPGVAILENPPGESIGCLVPGVAEGILTGGNLTVMVSTLGTPYEIDTRGKILFLEDIGEETYRIDRMLTQLALAGKLEETAGFLLGTWTGCGNDGGLPALFEECFRPIGKPAVLNIRAGHCHPALSLPFGNLAKIKAMEGSEVTVSFAE